MDNKEEDETTRANLFWAIIELRCNIATQLLIGQFTSISHILRKTPAIYITNEPMRKQNGRLT